MSSAVQADDFGMDFTAGAEKKISKRVSVGAEAELRTRNDNFTLDRWSFGVDASFKLIKGLKLSAGYTLLDDNNYERITYHSDGTINKWRPSYWGLRHRFNVSLTGSIDFGRFSASLRERWQYTYRPDATTCRYDFDDKEWDETYVEKKHKHVLRSRVELQYNIRKRPITPFLNAEFFNSLRFDKMRCQLGLTYKFSKHHFVDFYYQYQHVNARDDDNEYDSHMMGVAYKFKF